MSNPQKGRQRPRNKGDPSWYDTSLGANANPEEEVMEIPRDKVGLVIGKQWRRVREIREQTGTQISIKENKAHLRGTVEQREKARKIIEEVLNPNASGEGSSNRVGLKKLQNLLIPERLISRVIGKGRENLNMIQTKTEVTLRVINNEFYIKAPTEEAEKLAVREIREIASLWLRRFQTKVPFTKFVYVDAAQLEDNHEFELKSVPLPLANSKGPCYKLQLLEHPLNEETVSGFTDVENLREKILKVLKQIKKEMGEVEVKVDMWCHLGHAYLTKVDEDELEEDTFTLKKIIEKTESADSNSWGTFFKEGVEEMELQYITTLPSQSTKEDIRQDFTFYTPSCRNVRVKAWLIEHDDGEQGSAESQSNMAFSASAPVPVKNVLSQVLCNEGDTSSAPCFHICSPFHHHMKVDILMPAKGLDCRLSIRTCKIDAPRSPEDDEEDKILKSYLMGMKIDKNELTLPPTSQLQDGFDLYYQRRSLRQTYQYEQDGEHFSLTVCKEQATNVDPCNKGTISINDIPAKTDIHLHCDEWDRVLDEGNWEPEQIVAKLPAFLQFLRSVQRNVAPLNVT